MTDIVSAQENQSTLGTVSSDMAKKGGIRISIKASK